MIGLAQGLWRLALANTVGDTRFIPKHEFVISHHNMLFTTRKEMEVHSPYRQAFLFPISFEYFRLIDSCTPMEIAK